MHHFYLIPYIFNDLSHFQSTTELQNAIHAVEVQIREAVHIKNRYYDIRRSLKDDADKFDSNVKKLEEDLEGQKVDIEKLQKVSFAFFSGIIIFERFVFCCK